MIKKRLIFLSFLSVIAGIASAQSSVTLFGTIDINGRYVKTDGQPRRLTENPSGLNSGQLGFRGEEDLGDGLKAGFVLISENVADTGNAGANGKFFNRQSIVRLWGRWGELRLGRDYLPTYWNQAFFEPFGNLGLGNTLNIHQLYGGTRIDNSVGYILPTGLAGVYGEVKVAAAEGGSTLDRPGRYIGARLGYSAGPLDIAFSVGQQRFAINIAGITAAPFTGNSPLNNGPLVPITAGSNQKTYNVGTSYNFGVVKVLALVDREQVGDRRENLYSIGAIVPVGTAEIHASYDRSKMTPPAPGGLVNSTTLDQFAVGYVYNLSKRTAVYTTLSRLDNKQATTVTLPGSAGAAKPGGKSQGAEFGIRHFF